MKYEILVNKDNPIPLNYVVENLISVNDVYKEECKIEKETFFQYKLLKQFLNENYNIKIGIESGYRTIDNQIDIYNQLKEQYGKDYADKYVAKPGLSEHHTGLAIDLNLNINGKWCQTNYELMDQIETFEIVHQFLSNYGFILRYPIGKEEITEYPYEPWHIRYVGKELAQKVAIKNLTLEEYYDSIK